ncbi:hypothetical protein JJE66_16355 [Bradyrhizobium diazoefficiens]|nr:biotin carboxylase N-terminal domain-containing protein [Bradyrhizobium diazoefficiens]MBK3662798.1 hypothetical protein [Bradyrhizobium diazoefficiens]
MSKLVPAVRSRIRNLLVANRSEIAIRIFRAACELGLRTFAVYADEDKLSLHRFEMDTNAVERAMRPIKRKRSAAALSIGA